MQPEALGTVLSRRLEFGSRMPTVRGDGDVARSADTAVDSTRLAAFRLHGARVTSLLAVITQTPHILLVS